MVDPLLPHRAPEFWPPDLVEQATSARRSRPRVHRVPRASPAASDVAWAQEGTPAQLSESAASDIRPPRFLPPPRLIAAGQSVTPLIVYPPDQRRAYTDNTWPWTMCGLITTEAGRTGTGSIVGPRQVLTASHVMPWLSDGSVGWVQFQQAYTSGSSLSVSSAAVVHLYEEASPTGQGQYSVAEDYVVLIFDEPFAAGQFGTLGYDDDWNGTPYWYNTGYPDDIAGGQRPARQSALSVINDWSPGYFQSGHGLDLLTRASLTAGNSGGPFFGLWSEGPLPGCGPGFYIVAVVSASGYMGAIDDDWGTASRTGNWLASGNEMVQLVRNAINDYP
jgi:hypothetical protein